VPSASFDHCTISGNTAELGGGIWTRQRLLLQSTTLTETVASVAGGGFWERAGVSGDTWIGNTIVSGNSAPSEPDCYGSLRSTGYNIAGPGCSFEIPHASDRIGTDPMLEPLADNGGPTPTHALPTDSPAVDAGNPLGCGIPLDQRGFRRHTDGDCNTAVRCDIGAFELAGCGASDPTVYESTMTTSIVQRANEAGTATSLPHDHAPAVGPLRLYYKVDDDWGFPDPILLTKGGSGILIHF